MPGGFVRKLRALQYPHWDRFDPTDKRQYRTLIVWLEETKIRLYSIENRKPLRKVNEDETWEPAFIKYLKDLEYPAPTKKLLGEKDETLYVLDWMLSKAVSAEYSDQKELFNSQSIPWKPEDLSAKCNLKDSSVVETLHEIADLLKISDRPNTKALAKAVCSTLENKFGRETLANMRKNGPGAPAEKADYSKCDLGFTTGDKDLDRACRILRLMYINRLATLQRGINRGLVEAQMITANPKTDSRLGKVGYS
mmetsp:Transcript_30948/g.50306  ORF Transcript_30948/g.50306 Transcript_30948/m.50306 type:complete len:252 (+) Transcript_30948:39-794(+)|eukprot:jgi/Bigna1/89532/estExt_fgenesh1_pg.C_510042